MPREPYALIGHDEILGIAVELEALADFDAKIHGGSLDSPLWDRLITVRERLLELAGMKKRDEDEPEEWFELSGVRCDELLQNFVRKLVD